MEEHVQATQMIRKRIQRMESGFWLEEIDEALEDVRKASERALSRRLTAAGEDAQKLLQANMEPFVQKVLLGDARKTSRIIVEWRA